MTDMQGARPLSRAETHDLGMIIKDRAKVLRSHVEQRAAEILAKFDEELANKYNYDESVWRKIGNDAQDILLDAATKLHRKCEEIGVPGDYAPTLGLTWHGRGQQAITSHRAALRRMAQSRIDAMAKAAATKIEHTSLDLRTQVVAMGLLSPDAKLFLESLSTVDEAMAALEFHKVEIAVVEQQKKIQRGDYST
jgi:hypothetical protein